MQEMIRYDVLKTILTTAANFYISEREKEIAAIKKEKWNPLPFFKAMFSPQGEQGLFRAKNLKKFIEAENITAADLLALTMAILNSSSKLLAGMIVEQVIPGIYQRENDFLVLNSRVKNTLQYTVFYQSFLEENRVEFSVDDVVSFKTTFYIDKKETVKTLLTLAHAETQTLFDGQVTTWQLKLEQADTELNLQFRSRNGSV